MTVRDQSNSDTRQGILLGVSTRTKLLALLALILESLCLGSLLIIPETQRTTVVILSLIIVGLFLACIVFLEAMDLRVRADSQPVVFPREMAGSEKVVSEQLNSDDSAIGAKYRAATRMKLAGSYERAIDLFKAIRYVDEKHFLAWYNIGSCNLYQHKKEVASNSSTAAEHLDSAEVTFKELADYFSGLRRSLSSDEREVLHGCYVQLNEISSIKHDFKAGTAYLLQAVEVLPDDAMTYANLAISTCNEGNEGAAKAWFSAFAAHPNCSRVLNDVSGKDREILNLLQHSTQKRVTVTFK